MASRGSRGFIGASGGGSESNRLYFYSDIAGDGVVTVALTPALPPTVARYPIQRPCDLLTGRARSRLKYGIQWRPPIVVAALPAGGRITGPCAANSCAPPRHVGRFVGFVRGSISALSASPGAPKSAIPAASTFARQTLTAAGSTCASRAVMMVRSAVGSGASKASHSSLGLAVAEFGQLRTHAPQQNSITRSPRRRGRTDRAARRGRVPSRS